MGTAFTIGYGNRDAEALWAALRDADVGVLVDVRSAPYSRHRPEFSKRSLQREAIRRGFEYRFLGEELGGRPDAPTCYSDGRIVYARCRERAPFREGIVAVAALADAGQRPCLLCAEEDPARCHRTELITPALIDAGVEVVHLLRDGSHEPHDDLVRRIREPQMGLFEDRGD